MAGELDLEKLLAGLKPKLNPGTYVFCIFPDREIPDGLDPVAMFQEEEGAAAVISKQQAEALGVEYEFESEWLTMEIHSSLEAVGMTAAMTTVLGNAGISANVIAAFYHDHIFVPSGRGEEAVELLSQMGKKQ